MSTGNHYNRDKASIKIDHAAASGVVGNDGVTEYEVLGEVKLSVSTTFTTSGTLTVQGRIKNSDTWTTIGTLTSGGDFDSFDIDVYDFIRFNFTVTAGSVGVIAASGFFKAASTAGGGGSSDSFTTIQPDAGTNPVASSATDTLTFTSSDASVTITGDSGTDTIDFTGAGGGAGDVTKVGTPVNNEIGVWTGDGTLEGESTFTYDSILGHLELTGEFDILHTATGTDEHALEIDCNAAGFGDVKAIDIDYITGAIGAGDSEAVVLVNIDDSVSTGGNIHAVEVLATTGSATVWGLLAGANVGPVEQSSGVFGDMDSALVNAVDQLAAFTSTGTDIAMFVADNDTVTIGNATMFQEIEFILATVASKNIAPTFEFSTGVGTWTAFTPVDGTNGMLNTGVIAWLNSDIPTWALGTGSEYLIRITRTVNGAITSPIEDLVQIAETATYTWDKDGDVSVNGVTSASLTASEMVISDGNKKLVSAAVATYPSLTELTYVKGVTSSIQTQLNAAFSDPMTTRGDMIIRNASNVTARLGTGTNGQFLTTDGTDLSWGSIAGGGDLSGPSSSVDNAIVRFDSTSGKLVQDYTSNAPTITDAGVASFKNATYAGSERIGAGSVAGGIDCIVFGSGSAAGVADDTIMGADATSTGTQSVCIGNQATAVGIGNVSIGRQAACQGNYSMALGRYARAHGTNSTAIGANTYVASGHQSSIAIGYKATTTAANQMVFGNVGAAITNFSIGEGATSTSPQAVVFQVSDCSGTDKAGTDFTFKSSGGTGTGVGGHLLFQTCEAGTTGTSINAGTTHLEITDDGYVVFATIPTSASGLPTGAIWSNSGVITIV